MKRFHCQACRHEVYFDSAACVFCGNALGYEPGRTLVLTSLDGAAWSATDGEFRRCANAERAACNWLVGEADPNPLCRACRHNRTIPDLSDAQARLRWLRIEAAKRTLFYALHRWRLPTPTKSDDPERGLAFDFLADTVDARGTVVAAMTGHASGLITLAVAEGDDAERERRRVAMREPYRTLLGHFRHEISHYLWDRLIADRGREADLRPVFGDEREDYGAALARHHTEGPPADWPERWISAYASAHPWEDWAETAAHYFHMIDALETARAFALSTTAGETLTGEVAVDVDPYRSGSLDELVAAWVPLTLALNAMNRSMGLPDLYPFVLAPTVLGKLEVVHTLFREASATIN